MINLSLGKFSHLQVYKFFKIMIEFALNIKTNYEYIIKSAQRSKISRMLKIASCLLL